MSSILKPFEEGRIQGKLRMKQLNPYLFPKSLYISRAVSKFYGTEIEIWAVFGPDGNTEKKIVADYEQLLRAVFHVFIGKRNF